ncbi:MAG: peptidylprolyl isomerase [Candidatus Limnocylindria bacterium]
MTLRAKPVVKRSQKPSWESRDRRNFYLNLGFGIVVVTAILILLAAIGVSYYNQNLATVATVGGQTINRAELRERVDIETWRLTEAERRVRTAFVAGQLTQAELDLQNQIIGQQRERVVSTSLERMIDNIIQADLAVEEGITVTDADIDARLAEEATTPETRRSWVIEVEPVVEEGALEATPEAIAAARTTAEEALADLRAGEPWDDVARTVSTDESTAQQAGDLGWLSAEDRQVEEAFLDALFSAEVDRPTDVVEGEDGIFRIGRVTEISAEQVDAAYEDKLVNDDIDLARYREVVRGDVVREKLEEKVVAEATKPGPQRDVREIYIAESEPGLPETAVKVRHILYSPKDDPSGASSGAIPASDPSWARAKVDADLAFKRLEADPSLFDTIARTESDEEQARGLTGSGGKLGGYITEETGFVESFLDPILEPGLEDGDLVGPFKTEFGWHIAQIMYHPPDGERMELLKRLADGSADFAALARDNSESQTAGRGGALGWVARGQLDETLIDAIFGAPIGGTSIIVDIDGDGLYLYEILAEEQRTPEGRQLEEIRATAFADWYAPKKEAVAIDRDPSLSGLPTS